MGKLRTQNYEGLPPEVGAFNSKKLAHAPWPVHNLAVFSCFFDDFETLGVGVIPGVWMPLDGVGRRVDGGWWGLGHRWDG